MSDSDYDPMSFEMWEQGDVDDVGLPTDPDYWDNWGSDSEMEIIDVEIDDWLPGETTEERNARLRQRNDAQRQQDRPAGSERDPTQFVITTTRTRRAQARSGVDLRSLLHEAATVAGLSLEELLRPTPVGRLAEEERNRRDSLARAVAQARTAGATLEAIGLMTNRPAKTVSMLEIRGRALLG